MEAVQVTVVRGEEGEDRRREQEAVSRPEGEEEMEEEEQLVGRPETVQERSGAGREGGEEQERRREGPDTPALEGEGVTDCIVGG